MSCRDDGTHAGGIVDEFEEIGFLRRVCVVSASSAPPISATHERVHAKSKTAPCIGLYTQIYEKEKIGVLPDLVAQTLSFH